MKIAFKRRKLFLFLIPMFLILIILGGGIAYKFIKHEKGQNEKISTLQEQVGLLQAEVESDDVDIEWGDGFNYLAIGNSITNHPLADYWWQEDGMAATDADKDYFHLVTDYLEQNNDDVTTYAFNASAWEVQTNDRYEVLSVGLWDGYLSEELDLVTIQLSENVTDTATFEADFKEMVEYVIEECPDAQIIVIDDFWSDEKSELKENAIQNLDVDFVDLSEIRNNEDYMAGMGTIVYDADGNEHTIEHEGVAKHPNDLGMEYYAEKIEELIG